MGRAIMASGIYWDLSRPLLTRSLPQVREPFRSYLPRDPPYCEAPSLSYLTLSNRKISYGMCGYPRRCEICETPKRLPDSETRAMISRIGFEMAPWFGDTVSRRTSKRGNSCF